MSATVIDGKQVAREIEVEVLAEIRDLGFAPGLTVVRVGNDPASEIYVRAKARKALELGIRSTEKHFPATISESELLAEIAHLNGDPEVDGILVQLPVPPHIEPARVIDAIDPSKDVDGFHPVNVGRLYLGRPTLAPCTPAGIIRLIESTRLPIEGATAVVVGRSDIVGKPTAALLLQRNATVTICHSRTRSLGAVVRNAEIVVAAVGRPFTITADMIRPGAVVIDVGTNRVDTSFAVRISHDPEKARLLEKNGTALVGDVDFVPVRAVAGFITPVPGGVGPMTIAMLMKNTIAAATGRRS